MQRLPNEYLFIDKDLTLYHKRYGEKKTITDVNPYTLGSIPVIFFKGATVETIFNLVESEKSLQDICFYCKEFLKEAKSDRTNEKVNGKLSFYWPVIELEEDYPETAFPMMSVGGTDIDGTAFSIEFLSANNIKHLALDIDRKQNYANERGEILYTKTIYPTLLHLVYGLFWEMSFFGSPVHRDEKAEELIAAVYEAKMSQI